MKRRRIRASLMIAVWILFLMPASSWACGLAFLNGSSPTIDGSLTTVANEWGDASRVSSGEPCLGLLPDAPPGATGVGDVTTTPPGSHQVVFYTKRDANNLYIGIDVDDETGGGSILLGERIIVHLDPDNSRDANLTATDFRLDFTYMRGAPGDDIIDWYRGTGGAWTSTALPAGVEIGRRNRPAGPLGYIVEIKIPFAAIGYVLSADPDAITDIGMAIAVINDMALSDGTGGWYMAGVAFPETETLHLNNENDVMDTTEVQAAWHSPQNWGEAYLSGAGQQIYISRDPKSYLSEDIKAGFCNAVSFDDVGVRSTTNPKWYKYKSTNPCPLRLWGKVRRKGALVGVEKRNVLWLWAEHGANPQKWHYIDLVAIELPAGSSFAITPRIDWDSIPAGKIHHPCVRAFILPADLKDDVVDEAFLQSIGSEAGNNANKLTQIRNAYGLATAHEAQMNIHMVDTFACPECLEGQRSQKKQWLAAFSVVGASYAQTTVANSPEAVSVISHPEGKVDDYVVEFQLNGVAISRGAKKYRYVEVLGGVQDIVNIDYLRKMKEINIPFNIANSGDMARYLYINAVEYYPNQYTQVTLQMDQPEKPFEKGETRVVKPELKDASTPHRPCLPIGGGIGLTLLGMGVVGIGIFSLRRRANRA